MKAFHLSLLRVTLVVGFWVDVLDQVKDISLNLYFSKHLYHAWEFNFVNSLFCI